jgi:hypothetical protein
VQPLLGQPFQLGTPNGPDATPSVVSPSEGYCSSASTTWCSSEQFTRYEHSAEGKVTAFFANGTSATGDLLVGADAVRSRVRGQFLPAAREVETPAVGVGGKIRASSFERKYRSTSPFEETDSWTITTWSGRTFSRMWNRYARVIGWFKNAWVCWLRIVFQRLVSVRTYLAAATILPRMLVPAKARSFGWASFVTWNKRMPALIGVPLHLRSYRDLLGVKADRRRRPL